MMINLIITAAGKGSRFSSHIPKQFLKINGQEILEFNIKKWISLPNIKKIYLVLPQEDFLINQKRYQKLSSKVMAIKGSTSRAESIYEAIKKLDTQNPITLVHDGVRPFFTHQLIHKIIEAVQKHQAVIPALKLTDTIKKVSGNQILQTINRESLVSIQTPQAFTTEIIIKAYSNLKASDLNFDDSQLVENINIPVFFIEGERNNIKLTTQDDLDYAEYLMEKQSNKNKVKK